MHLKIACYSPTALLGVIALQLYGASDDGGAAYQQQAQQQQQQQAAGGLCFCLAARPAAATCNSVLR
jgi:hypothetical protein